MLNHLKHLLICTLLLFSIQLTAQNASIKGVAKDSIGNPISYVNIGLKGTGYGSITDVNGLYTINNIQPGEYVLVATFVGYDAFETKISLAEGQKEEIDLTLKLGTAFLEDVIVTARRNNPNERIVPSISKLPVQVKYQTQSITILDNKLLAEQQLINLDEAINYAPGFNLESTRGNQFPKIQVRGSNATLLINGLRLQSNTRSGDGNVDFNSIDNIQFINGSSSIGLGNASIGGAVNMITKKAQFNNDGSAFISAGSFGRTNSGFDKQFTTADNKLGIRLNGSWNKGETFRKGVDYEYVTLAPSLAYKLSDKDKITLDYIYRDDERSQDVGQLRVDSVLLETVGITIPNSFRPSINQDIRNDFIGFEDDFQRQKEHTAFFGYEREFNSNLRLQINGGLYEKNRTSRGINTRRAYTDTNRDRINDAFTRSSVFQKTGAVNQSVRADLIGQDIKWLGFNHNLQFSVDLYSNENYVQGNGPQSRDQGPAIDVIDLLNPVFVNKVSDLPLDAQQAYYSELLNTENRSFRNINGITFQDQLSITNKLRATIGLRYTWGSSSQELTENLGEESQTTAESDVIDYDGFSPSFGLFYDITPNIIAFGTYSNTFDETSISPNRVDINGNVLGNEVFEQTEIGLRSSFFDNAFGANLTFYNIYNNNGATLAVDDNNDPLLSSDAITPTNPEGEYFVRVEQQQRRGAELSLQGKITEGLNVYGTYAFYEFSQRADEDMEAVIQTTDYNPTHTASLITNYQFQNGFLKDFRIGGGLVYTGDRTVTARGRNAFTFNNPAFTTYTLTAGYSFKELSIDAKLNNVTNELQYNFFGTTFINPISPANFDLRITYNF